MAEAMLRFTIRHLLCLTAAIAVALGLLRGVIADPEPYWGLSGFLVDSHTVGSRPRLNKVAAAQLPIVRHLRT